MTQVDRNEVTVIKGINGTALQHAGHSRIKALCHLSQLCLVLESAHIPPATICPGSIIFCLSCCWPGTISLMFDTKRAKWDPPSFPVFDPLWRQGCCLWVALCSCCPAVEMSPLRTTHTPFPCLCLHGKSQYTLSMPDPSVYAGVWVFHSRPHGAC